MPVVSSYPALDVTALAGTERVLVSAPDAGGAGVRRMGIGWVPLASGSIVANTEDIILPLPTSCKLFRLTGGNAMSESLTGCFIMGQGSEDGGLTWIAGATDYTMFGYSNTSPGFGAFDASFDDAGAYFNQWAFNQHGMFDAIIYPGGTGTLALILSAALSPDGIHHVASVVDNETRLNALRLFAFGEDIASLDYILEGMT